MTEFFQNLIDGLANGAIYASLALALVLVHRATNVVNFAQGEMAMFATYVAWAMSQSGFPIWLCIAVAAVGSFVVGAATHQVLIRRFDTSDELNIVILTLGIFLTLNGLATIIWSGVVRSMPSPFPPNFLAIGDTQISVQALGTVAVLATELLVLVALFKFTKIGLAMRASADNPVDSRLVGISSSRMHMLGWGIAATLGTLAGVLAAPRLFIEPHFMFGVLIYAFAATVLGGINSPMGAVVGGLAIGVTVEFLSSYVPSLGGGLQIVIAPVIVVIVLLLRPQGLFGKAEVVRL